MMPLMSAEALSSHAQEIGHLLNEKENSAASRELRQIIQDLHTVALQNEPELFEVFDKNIVQLGLTPPKFQVAEDADLFRILKSVQFFIEHYFELEASRSSVKSKSSKKSLKKVFENDLAVDEVNDDDHFNRNEFAQYLVQKIKKIMNHPRSQAYTIHLAGGWGEGKSQFLRKMEKEFVNDPNENWTVIEFNAWRYQHLIPNWWGFLEVVRDRLTKNLSFFEICRLHMRLISFSWPMLAVPFVGFLATVGFFIFGDDISSKMNSAIDNPLIQSFLKNSVGGVSLLAMFWGLWNFIVKSQAVHVTKLKERYTAATDNSLEKASCYFEKLLKETVKGGKLAVFIDDLDRCSPNNAVALLEAIQTLFRKDRVLYVISADSKWLRRCFEIEYKELKTDISRYGCGFGYHFLEKLIQLTFRLPNDPTQENFDRAVFSSDTSSPSSRTNPNGTISDTSNRTTSHPEVSKANNDFKNIEANEKVDWDYVLYNYRHFFGTNPRLKYRIRNSFEINRACIGFEQRYRKTRPLSLRNLAALVALEQRWPLILEKFAERDQYLDALQNNDFANLTEPTQDMFSNVSHDKTLNEIIAPLTPTDIDLFLGRETSGDALLEESNHMSQNSVL